MIGGWPATRHEREEMVVGLLGMILGLVLFFGVHTLTTQREARARAIASLA